MLRWSSWRRCLVHDVRTGIPSDYRPRYRPRRLVMPVDSWQMHSEKRATNPLLAHQQKTARYLRTSKKRGTITLSTVPSERTAADGARFALESAQREGFTRLDECLASQGRRLSTVLGALKKQLTHRPDNVTHEGAAAVVVRLLSSDSNAAAAAEDGENASIVAIGCSPSRDSALSHTSMTLWNLLEHTSMDAPAHGMLALRGKGLVETTILELLYSRYPRLRSQHAQVLIHQCTGLLPMSRVATRVGLVELFGVHTEVGLWRELNTLTERFRTARKMATAHKERVAVGIAAQRRWYWRNVLKSAARKLNLMPVDRSQLQPRMEWLRDQVFQWFAAVEALEGLHTAKALIYRLCCASLYRHIRHEELVEEATKLLEAADASRTAAGDAFASQLQQLYDDVRRAAAELQRLMRDEDSVVSDLFHPMNHRGHQRYERFHSSFGSHGMEPLKGDSLGDAPHVAKRVQELAPPSVVHLVNPENAFKEAQLVLRYDPWVSAALREAPIDVDITVRHQVEVHETNQYNSLVSAQQFRQVQYRVARLFAGKTAVGEGKGETEMQAIHDAALHMLHNYYFRRPTLGTRGMVSVEEVSESGHRTTAEPSDGRGEVSDKSAATFARDLSLRSPSLVRVDGEDDEVDGGPHLVESPSIRVADEQAEYFF